MFSIAVDILYVYIIFQLGVYTNVHACAMKFRSNLCIATFYCRVFVAIKMINRKKEWVGGGEGFKRLENGLKELLN